ncbi:MAG: MMPL family transporter, partial [Clostridiales Family XIII bacterium]|jgi:predicted RND superfamily exporter protein|nr:MMPL family transporter [Clostridiales Family XIII bacterium]
MEVFFHWIVTHKKSIIIIFVFACGICAYCSRLIKVNYDINDYLPDGSPSTVAIQLMKDEFGGDVPNCRVMASGLTVPQALELKKRIGAIEGVDEILWLDDEASLEVPLMMIGPDVLDAYYRDGTALYNITVDDEKRVETVNAIRALVGEDGRIAGTAAETAAATQSTVKEIARIIMIAGPFCLFILILTTVSWVEPILILGSIGVAILLNMGTNLIFGEISFITNAAGSILQLAVSLDYAVFLLHRFREIREDEGLALPAGDPGGLAKAGGPGGLAQARIDEAMVGALSKSIGSILSSGLTTFIGFAALILMRFKIGPDMGLVLAKGVFFSLLTVFTLLPAATAACTGLIDRASHRRFLPSFDKFGGLIAKIMMPAAIVFCIIIIPCNLAQKENDFYYGASKIFGEQTELGRDTIEIEEAFGRSMTMAILVPRGDYAVERQMTDEIKRIPQVRGVISYVDTVGAEIPPEYIEERTRAMMLSEGYSRIVVDLSVPPEGGETFAVIERMRGILERFFPGRAYIAGQGASNYDLMYTVIDDNTRVNTIAIAAVFIVLALVMRSLITPVALVAAIETAIWLNLSFPYFAGKPLFYLGYLIISSIQLGATVDYAILLTSRYKEYRVGNSKKEAVRKTMAVVTVPILTSAVAMIAIGFLLGFITTHGLLSQFGFLLGRGALLSVTIVLSALPGLLCLLDRPAGKSVSAG